MQAGDRARSGSHRPYDATRSVVQEAPLKSLRPAIALTVFGALALAACGGSDSSSATTVLSRPTINVAHTGDPVSELLAEIYGQGLETAGYRVGRKDPSADRSATMAALEADSAQLVPEMSATLLAYLSDKAGTENTATTIDDQLTALKTALPATLTPGPVTGAEGTTVVACSQAAVAAHSLKTVSDLAGAVADVTLGGSADFESATSFGLDALNTAYAVTFTFTPVADDQVSAKLSDGTIDCAVVPETLAAITVDGLLTLDDDKNVFPLDVAFPLMTAAAATPDVVAVLTQLNTPLTTDVLRALLVKVAVGDQSYDVIAKQFLASQSSGK
jgi:osmoprotectant transport system substrate-binding protein